MFSSVRKHRLTIVVALVSAILVASPATAAKFFTKKQVKKKFWTKAQADARYSQGVELATSDGNAPNQGSNLVHWDNLAGVPPGFADGTDDAGEAADPAWLLAGNAGTDPASQFVGTTDNQPLNFRVNNARALRLEPDATSPNVIGGFSGNEVSTSGATIGGGGQAGSINQVTGDFGTVGGGQGNTAGESAATVGGGLANTALGLHATVGGGGDNSAGGTGDTVSGGAENTADASHATIGGGRFNDATGGDATIGGGAGGTASGSASTIGGGGSNTASGNQSTIGGGHGNTASGLRSNIDGGLFNSASGTSATVGGGDSNSATGTFATIGGGQDNQVTAQFGTIGGGAPSNLADVANTRNIVTDEYGTVGGGGDNQAGDAAGTTTDRIYATVGGGISNTASGTAATVGGGDFNTASGSRATVPGGLSNTASGTAATVGGGSSNTAGGGATVGGGIANTASGSQATVPGGLSNTAAGDYSFAAGRRAKTGVNSGAFVWADSQDADMTATAANQFIARASGEFFLQSDSTLDDQGGFLNTSTGGFLSTTGVWTDSSSRTVKEHFAPVDPGEVLGRVAELPVTTWNYAGQDPAIRHIGPTAEDFHATFGVGESDRHLASLDTAGVALVAIKGLNEKVDALRLAGGGAPGSGTVAWQALLAVVMALGIGLAGRRTRWADGGGWPSS